MTDVRDAIRERRSVGRVTDAPVARALVERLLEAALWAPNHRMTGPWRFVVVAGDARDALGDAHARAVGRAAPETADEVLEAQRALTRRAPVVIACISHPSSEDPVVRREDRDAVSAAIQNLLLVAHAEGLGAIWRTGAFVDEAEVRGHLGCGPHDEIVGLVYVGWPAAPAGAPPPRPALGDAVEWRGM
ncbi:MAG TPA: nitroreductase [Miltoncostaeaceae bacterium]|nr:nitroreductase [Miltoncostaeaceae bacterium]